MTTAVNTPLYQSTYSERKPKAQQPLPRASIDEDNISFASSSFRSEQDSKKDEPTIRNFKEEPLPKGINEYDIDDLHSS